ncbi:hypothetical protein [Serratia sp. NPDC087055]|uniref:hypothetical protein n=1 Tax=Serratia sp. NPDC087055 TaxID=3364516 RepID=UPI00384AD875
MKRYEYINSIARGGAPLSEELLDAIFNFTLLFSMAEHRLMRENARTGLAGIYAKRFVRGANLEQEIRKVYNYFTNRYTVGASHKYNLDDLCHHDKKSRVFIEQTIQKQNPNEHEVAECVFRIIIRLRHNLFHGRKWTYNIQGQEENLLSACYLLHRILKNINR